MSDNDVRLLDMQMEAEDVRQAMLEAHDADFRLVAADEARISIESNDLMYQDFLVDVEDGTYDLTDAEKVLTKQHLEIIRREWNEYTKR